MSEQQPSSNAAAVNGNAANGNGKPLANPTRRKALLAVASVVVIAGIAWAGYEWIVGRNYESTDNAYVQGNVIQITPQVGGTVMAILADDTDFVKAGQPLVKLDPADAKVALEQAEANLGQAVRMARTLYANNATLAAQIALKQSDVARAESEIARSSDDLARRQSLVGNGAVSREELNHAQTQLANARSALAAAQAGVVAAREQLASNRALTEGTSLELHPSVQAAAGKVREAWLALQRAAMPAPVDGYVAKRTVQLGQRVAAGTPMMSIIPLRQLWVDANFKEVQLRNIRIGQPVTLTADVYGQKVEYRGAVAGLGAGTGAAFALLPAQNATGNWIKVVQRVPVRIALDPKQVAEHPLRVGLSMEATVDVRNRDGKTLADSSHASMVAQTPVYSAADSGADEEVRRIIAANGGAVAASSVAGRKEQPLTSPANAAPAAPVASAPSGAPLQLKATSPSAMRVPSPIAYESPDSATGASTSSARTVEMPFALSLSKGPLDRQARTGEMPFALSLSKGPLERQARTGETQFALSLSKGPLERQSVASN